MSWRAVAVYWVLALAVVGQLAWTLRARHPVTEAQASAVAPIIDVAPASLDELRAERGDRALEFRKESGRWESVGGVGNVSSDLIGALIDTLATIPPVEVLTEAPSGLAAYGLDPPETVVRIASSGQPVAVIELGARNPTRTAVYARRPDVGRVYLLGLNAQYYLDLVFEQASGAEPPPAG